MLSGRDATTAKFEGRQLVQVILTKGGLRLPKALVVTPSCRPVGLGLVALIWKPLLDASVLLVCACLLSTKEETRTLCALDPPGLDRHGSRHWNLARFALP